ncbi:MAG: sugar transferase, partial [Janthinobacterium lividum]
MDARVEIAAAALPRLRSRGPDYLGLLNDCLSAWNFAGAVLGGVLAWRVFEALSGHAAAAGVPGGAVLREVLFGSLLAAVVLHDRTLVSPAGFADAGMLLRRMLVRVGLAAALLLGVGFATRSLDDTSRLWVVLWAVPALGLALLGRVALLLHVRRLLRCGSLRSVVAVVGEGEAARRVMHSLSHPGSGIELLGPFGGGGGAWSAGSVDDLVRLAQRQGVPDRVIVARSAGGDGAGRDEAAMRDGGEAYAMDDLTTVMRRLRELPAEISLCQPLELPVGDAAAIGRQRADEGHALSGMDRLGRAGLRLAAAGARMSGAGSGYGALHELPLLRVADRPLSAWGGVAKNGMDKALAGGAVLALSPLLLAIAIAVRLDSPGPAVFRQERDGWNGRSFTVLKFRTMRAAPGGHGLVQTARGDARCTRLGRFLRRSSLDELPQLFNVLRGDMS